MSAYSFDEFVFDDVRYELRRSGVSLKVDAQVLELLAYMLRNPARVVTKEELIAEVWQGRALGDNVISVCVAKLRKVLGGPSNRCITNVYGRGYRFLRPVQAGDSAPESVRPTLPPVVAAEGAPFVGRSAALSRLHGALDRLRGGRGGVCALLGEAGIGKTKLAEVLEQQAHALGVRVSWGRSHAFGDMPPLWPWQQIVRTTKEPLPPEFASETLGDPRRALDAHDSASDDKAVADANDQGVWTRMLSWISGVVARNTSQQPWMIVLEDVQWADAASLALLAHVLTESTQLPLLLLLTVRDTELPREPRSRRALDYVLGHRETERIELGRLRLADVDAYVNELFGRVDRSVAEAAFKKSEGNPFFMVELLRPWIEGEPPSANELGLAGPALDIVRQALRRLDAGALEVLAAAAVVGRSFDLGLLAVVTERDHEALIELLEDAMSMHVIVASRDNHTHFAFGHDLIRSVLYDEQPSIARVRIHQRVADALAARQASGGASASAEIAHHLLSALPSGNVLHAVASARWAALGAVKVGAYADACSFLSRALDALRQHSDADPQIACRVLFDLAQCERGCGEPGYMGHYREAAALAKRHGYGPVLAAVGQLMNSTPGIVGTEGACKVLESALQVLPTTERGLRASVLAHLTWTPPYSSDTTKVATLLAEAQQLSEGANEAARRSVLRARLYYAGGPDDHEQALAIAGEMERMPNPHGSRQRARRSLEPQVARVVALLQRGDMNQAQRAVDAFGASAHELNHAEVIWHYDRMCVVLRMNLGEFEYARTKLGELKERAERLQLHGRRAVEAIDWGELIRLTSDVTPFAAQLTRHLQPAAADPPSVVSSKLRALVQLGSLDEARATLHTIPVSGLMALPKSRDFLATFAHLAYASVETRSLDHAAALYAALEPYPKFCVASLSFHVYGVVAHFLAILSRVLGHGKRAMGHFDVALAEQERLGLAPQLARTRFELAKLLVDSRDVEDTRRARRLLQQARDVAGGLKMEPLRASAEQLLAGL